MNLFAYGTLMWPEIMAEVIGRKAEGRPAILCDVRRLRVKGEVYPSLVLAEAGDVDGVCYFDLTSSEMAALDQFEGDEYVRRTVEVQLGEQRLPAEVYFASEQGLALLEPDGWVPGHLSADELRLFRESYKGWG